MEKKELLRRIPKVDEVLMDRRLFMFFENTPRDLIVEAVRGTIDDLRNRILAENSGDLPIVNKDLVVGQVVEKIKKGKQKNLRRIINGTGTILHTNLGRARLSKDVSDNICEATMNYSTLEYDLKKGSRGSRHDHIEKLIANITATEAAMVVNNNAAAVLLCLSALAKDREVIVSRGELVEIGGSFRIPDIMELGGAFLREVGTTNKTKLDDYKLAIDSEKTAALLKVHTSNYKIMGFTAEVDLAQLAELAREMGLPLVYDLGSGLMVDLKIHGIDEPTVIESVKSGADVITISGDKLLGGPQAGIIIGKKLYIDMMKKHPLARAVRVDKMTLAALELTFREYLDPARALKSIPTLKMITEPIDELRGKAILLAEQVRRGTDSFDVDVVKTECEIGGGSTPNQFIKSYGVSIKGEIVSTDRIERDMRAWDNPVIVRINRDRVLIDMRTVSHEEIEIVAQCLISCGDNYSRSDFDE